MSFENNLCRILEKLNTAREPEDIYEDSVKQRLEKSLKSYQEELQLNVESTLNENKLKVMRKLNK